MASRHDTFHGGWRLGTALAAAFGHVRHRPGRGPKGEKKKAENIRKKDCLTKGQAVLALAFIPTRQGEAGSKRACLDYLTSPCMI